MLILSAWPSFVSVKNTYYWKTVNDTLTFKNDEKRAIGGDHGGRRTNWRGEQRNWIVVVITNGLDANIAITVRIKKES